MSSTTPNALSAAPSNRFIRLRCPLCDHRSPVCDQSADIRRDLLMRWWQAHLNANHRPAPIFERVEQA